MTYNADERQLYGDALEAAGFRVSELHDPTEALRLVRTQPPAAVITRIMQRSSALDGIELTRLIKSDPTTASVRVIIITSFMQPEYKIAAQRAGCDEYRLLPVLPDELVSAVKRVTSSA